MREIKEHQVNECNQAIMLTADEPDMKNGGASHKYNVSIKSAEGYTIVLPPVVFQRGPIKEAGTNGVTQEVLLAILIDRLRGFQAGAYACDENHRALLALCEARDVLYERTAKRVERGVEGTYVV